LIDESISSIDGSLLMSPMAFILPRARRFRFIGPNGAAQWQFARMSQRWKHLAALWHESDCIFIVGRGLFNPGLEHCAAVRR
jgi:hypothetical protein